MGRKNLSLAFSIWCPIISLLFSVSVLSNTPSVPEGFDELFKKESKQVDFEDTDGVFHTIRMDVNYDSVQITSPEESDKLRAVLTRGKVNPTFIEQIISDLKSGVNNSEGCVGDISSCVLEPEEYALVFDYYTNKVYFWINPEYIESNYTPGDVVYADMHNQNIGLLNHFNAYTRFDQDTQNFSIYDDFVIGLPYGNISSDMNYHQYDDDFDMDELLYNLEFQKYRLKVGYTKNRSSFNSTDFLINGVTNGEWSVDFGTSRNLVLNGQRSIQKIFFFAPQSGVLTVYRNGNILLQKNVSQGQGYITNEELPIGRYDVRMVIRSGNTIVSDQIQSIFNTDNDSLVIGDVDYHLTMGMYGRANSDLLSSLDDDEFIDNNTNFAQRDDSVTGEPFARGLLAYRLSNRITLGVGASGSTVGNYLNAGSIIYLPLNSRWSFSSYFYDDESLQFESNFSLQNWTASVETFDASEEDGELAKYMFNDSDYQKYSLATNFDLGPSRFGYISYNYLKQDDSDYYDGFTSSYLTGGVSFSAIANSTIDINASYDFSDSLNDQLSASIVWSVPLSDFVTANATYRTTEHGMTQLSSGLETQDMVENDDIFLSARVDQNYVDTDPNNYTSATANGQINKEQYSASAYGYIDTKGERSINANISSSQVITKNNIYFTRHNSDAYLAVNTDNNIRFDEESASRGLLVVNRNGRQEKRRTLYEDEAVMPLRSYKSYQSYLDTDSVDLYNVGDKSDQAFSLPGTVIEMEPKISRVISFISGFKDIFDRSVKAVECSGEGCVSVDEITDGVYKVSVKEGADFTLQNPHAICQIPPVDDMKLFNFGENYCFPNVEKMASMPLNIGGEEKTLVFLGEYNTKAHADLIDHHLGMIGDDELQFIKKEVGANSYVYAVAPKTFHMTAQIENVLDNMTKYANKKSSFGKSYALER